MLTISNILANLTFASQNVNSLNVSTNCPKQLEKVVSIMDSKADIIFLSDVRLKSPENAEDLKKYFQNSEKHNDFFFNSSKSSRGVAILISRDVEFEIDRIDRDPTENVLNLKCSKQNVFFFLI